MALSLASALVAIKATSAAWAWKFRGHTTLLSYPDPRRIDIRQTIRDPMEQVYVRIFNQKSATPVFVMCDLSGSMQYGLPHTKLNTAAQITRSVAQSATHNADPVGFIGFDDELRDEWLCTLSARPHSMLELADRLENYLPPENRGSRTHGECPSVTSGAGTGIFWYPIFTCQSHS